MAGEMKQDCMEIFRAGLRAVDASQAVMRHVMVAEGDLHVRGRRFRLSDFEHVSVIGAGKASAPMALALEELLGERIFGGLVVVKYGHGVKLKKIDLAEAGHPVPDEAGLAAARRLLSLARQCTEHDLVLCVFSGGASALLSLPVPEVSFRALQETTALLLGCGAAIEEINAVRKHLSPLAGGGLARAASPAHLVSLVLSDVVGDDLAVIASGPTVPDESTFAHCLGAVERYHLGRRLPASVEAYLREGMQGKREETLKPGDPVFAKTQTVLVGSNRDCLEAAEAKARALGYTTLILSCLIQGEAREVAKVHAAIVKEMLRSGRPVAPPACVLSGGETTVTIEGEGSGGRNQEFSLAGGIEIAGWKGAAVFSAGTDGTDGPTDAAGAYADWRMVERAQALHLDPREYLRNHDSYHFFARLGDLVMTGPTRTNVMDLMLLLAA
jgi:glycerate 2-kinase